VPDPVLFLEEFLAPSELGGLQQFAQEQESRFVPSEVLDDDAQGHRDDDVRRSRVLFDVEPIRPLVTDRVLAVLPWVLGRLGLPAFPVRELELQVTSSNDGEWFRAHRDGGAAGGADTRELTFVYYCHREPAGFTGGHLRMFLPPDDATSVTIAPPQNAVVFFPSHRLHEVLPVTCPSRRFADSRLTVNGWLHR
jgi:Rps23 Pro-64 3,4-dihydroxylase Tpa1-like proline 4-hydroxylase